MGQTDKGTRVVCFHSLQKLPRSAIFDIKMADLFSRQTWFPLTYFLFAFKAKGDVITPSPPSPPPPSSLFPFVSPPLPIPAYPSLLSPSQSPFFSRFLSSSTNSFPPLSSHLSPSPFWFFSYFVFSPFHFRVLGRIFLLIPFLRTLFHDTLSLEGSISLLQLLFSTSLFSMTLHLFCLSI